MPFQQLYDSGDIDLRGLGSSLDDSVTWSVSFPLTVDFPLFCYSSAILSYEWQFTITSVIDQTDGNLYRTRMNLPTERSIGRFCTRSGSAVVGNGVLEFEEYQVRGKSRDYTLLNSYQTQSPLYSSVIQPRFYARNEQDYKYCLSPLGTARPTTVDIPPGGLGINIYEGEFGIGPIRPTEAQNPPIRITLSEEQEVDSISGILYPRVASIGRLQIFYRYHGQTVVWAEPRLIGDFIAPPDLPVLCIAAGVTIKSIDTIIAEICACAKPIQGCTAQEIAICASVGLSCPCVQQ